MTVTMIIKMIIIIVTIILTIGQPPAAKCLQVKPHIHKGTLAKPDQFPWIAYLRIFPHDDDYFTECGGTLIDDSHILTAAHCLYIDPETLALPQDIYTLLNATREPWPMKNLNPAEAYFIHPQFDINKDWIMGHDLAIIRLSDPVNIKPICVHTSTEFNSSQKLIAAGYGSLDRAGSDDNYNLNYVTVDYIPRDECDSMRQKFVKSQLDSGKMDEDKVPILLETQLCAINEKTRGDTCAGDSGGPLVYPGPSGDELVGVVTGSWTDCGSTEVPGIYTWAAKYLDWIKSNEVDVCESP